MWPGMPSAAGSWGPGGGAAVWGGWGGAGYGQWGGHEVKGGKGGVDPWGAWYGGWSGGHSDKRFNDLVTRVKNGQRGSEAFKEAWWNYVRENGNDVRDPSKHDSGFLSKFLASAPDAHLAVSGGQGPAVAKDDQHQELMGWIKHGQRTSIEFKEAWIAFAKEYGNDNRDPGRHDASFLQTFLSSAPAVSQPPPVPKVVEDANQRALVNQVKQHQRSSQEFKESWWSFCDSHGNGVRDPARHPAEFLQQFLSSVGMLLDGSEAGSHYGKGFPKGGVWDMSRTSPY